MPVCRPLQLPVPANAIHVTLEFSIEIGQNHSLTTFDDMARPATPLIPASFISTTAANSSPQELSDPADEQQSAGDAFTEAVLLSIIQSERLDFYPAFTVSDLPPLIPEFTAEGAVRQINRSIEELASFGQQLYASEKPEIRTRSVLDEDFELSSNVAHWVFGLSMLQQVDLPLYHFMRNSLYSHTPRLIFLRWNAFRRHLSASGQMLVSVVRQAEELPRRKWPPLIWEFYLLLLEYVINILMCYPCH